MNYQEINKTVDGAIHILEIDRQEAQNKLELVSMGEILHALEVAEADPTCKTVIITGAGEFFCGGGALGDPRVKTGVEIDEFAQLLINVMMTIKKLSIPVIAAVQGHALGGGFSLVEACDLAVASKDATFGIPEIKGHFCPAIALISVAEVFGPKGSFELAFLGDPINAEQAKQAGLINWITEKDQVMAKAKEVANRIAASNPTSISASKQIYFRANEIALQQKFQISAGCLIGFLKSNDTKEILDAKEANRDPVWTCK